MKRLILFVFATAPAFGAGPLAFGVKGGTALNDLVDAQAPVQSLFRRWTLGPMIDLDLPLGLGVEFDALYRSTGYEVSPNLQTSSSSWEFPLLVKYKFKGAVARPYVGAGVSFRHIGDLSLLNQPAQVFQFQSGSTGFVMEGGVRIDLKLIKLAPELRYTYWGNQPLKIGNLVQYGQNQVEVLIGLTF
jgi:hypothetical protein